MEGIDDSWHMYINSHYRFFLNIIFKFQAEVCHGCHDLMQKAMSFNNAAIVAVKRNNYRIIFLYMSNDEAIYLLRNADLTEKSLT